MSGKLQVQAYLLVKGCNTGAIQFPSGKHLTMKIKRVLRLGIVATGLMVAMGLGWYAYRSIQNHTRLPGVPVTWEESSLTDLTLPLASQKHSPKLISASTYYWFPIRKIYKTYPVYHPDREPEGYLEWLKDQEPELAWDAVQPKSQEDWVQAGKLVFEAPLGGGGMTPSSAEYQDSLYVRDKRWHEQVRAPIAKDGTLPYYRYVIEKKGKVRVGVLSCAMCHSRVLDDGTVVQGAQGNFPFDRAFAYDYRFGQGKLEHLNGLERLLYHVPWVNDEAQPDAASADAIADRHDAIPPGVMARHASSPAHPVAISDLFELENRRFLDRTGVQVNRGMGDVMRYAALNQGADDLSQFGEFVPIKGLLGFVPPAILNLRGRYSDDQLYALASYVASLKPPPNPHPFDEIARRGQQVFESQDCGRCHTPPLYTSNKLTPAKGFTIPADHYKKYAIEPESLETDPALALSTRRGTGYYKIPSLKYAWLRGPFGHDGSCATLEDWFDPQRLKADYVPTGFKGQGVQSRAVPGHEYGLDLNDEDRRALIAFLRTL
jgi:hypothetical protein